jgi:hypothetical protein
MTLIHVLGAGPAGLLCAHEAVRAGHNVKIHSIKAPSDIKGAQFIHAPVPGITEDMECFDIQFYNVGSQRGYAEKVYGDPEAPTSWGSYAGLTVPAWSMVGVYGRLWELYSDLIVDTEVRYEYIIRLLSQREEVLSTITPQGYCQCTSDHEFVWQDVWISEFSEIDDELDNVIFYNGDPEVAWYRSSRINGLESTEFGHGIPEIPRKSRKPLSTNCDCLLEHVRFHRLGRFGAFQKTLLVSDAMFAAREISDALR